MAEIGLFELVGSMAALLGLFLGGNVAYTHWRIKTLEDNLTGAKKKHDEDMNRAHERIDKLYENKD